MRWRAGVELCAERTSVNLVGRDPRFDDAVGFVNDLAAKTACLHAPFDWRFGAGAQLQGSTASSGAHFAHLLDLLLIEHRWQVARFSFAFSFRYSAHVIVGLRDVVGH